MEKSKEEQQQEQTAEIDLSNLSNEEALEKKDREFANTLKNKKASMPSKKRSNKFNFSDAERIPLPSKGRFYTEDTDDSDVLDGFIQLSAMTAKEEEILSTRKFVSQGISTRMILDSCIESDIEAKDILLFDSNYLLFYLRKISYGDEYTFNIRSTEDPMQREFEHTLKISEMTFEELPEELEEPIVVKLPKSKYTVKCILPRLYHTEEINKRDMNRKRTDSSTDKRLIDKMVVTTTEILDDQEKKVPQKDWEEFFEALPGMDIATLRDETTFDTGVDEISNIVCPYTERTMRTTIPIGPEFFRF